MGSTAEQTRQVQKNQWTRLEQEKSSNLKNQEKNGLKKK